MLRMPGKSYAGALPALDDATRAIEVEVARDVRELAGEIGERNFVRPTQLEAAAHYIEGELSACKLQPQRQTCAARRGTASNIWTEIAGTRAPREIVVVGAHYDSVVDSPGANDNASGVACMLAIARRLASSKPARTLRFVAFVNEEPPHFQTDA